MKKRRWLSCLIFCFILSLACSHSQPRSDEWHTASLDSVGIDKEKIAELTKKIEDRTFNGIHSLLIVKDNKLVYEKYFNGFNADDLHPVFSVTKSISSALTGIAIDLKFLKDEHVMLKQFFNGNKGIDWGDKKDEITIKDILTMTSGLEWEESIPYSNWRNSHNKMARSGDWIKYVLNLPMAAAPGSRFNYNTGTSNLLAIIIEKATGMSVDNFAKKYLLDPLGIEDYKWYRNPAGKPCTGGSKGGIFLRPRDMARIGYLYLNKGKWKGQTIVSESWVEKSTGAQSRKGGYGYLWWRSAAYSEGRSIPFYIAIGYGGQRIYVIPGLDMVVVITSGYYGGRRSTGGNHIFLIFYKYIIPAVNLATEDT
jgi:CubicO group peptidase (beta-lactamase class C family)